MITGKPVTMRIPSPAGGVRIETFIPWTLVKRGARREVITPIATPAASREYTRRTQQQREREQHSPLLRALGLAHYWQQLLDDGKFRSITEIAAAEGIDLGRVSRMLRLARLSPAMVEVCFADLSNAPATEKITRNAALPDWNLQSLSE
jgi:hypothetical protein